MHFNAFQKFETNRLYSLGKKLKGLASDNEGTLLLHFSTRIYLFSPEEKLCDVFRPEAIVSSFFHSMMLLPKVLFNQSMHLDISFKYLSSK